MLLALIASSIGPLLSAKGGQPEAGNTSPAAIRRGPSAVPISSAPSSSRSRNRPNSVACSSRTRISLPRPAARASQASRIGANPSFAPDPRPGIEPPDIGLQKLLRTDPGKSLFRQRGRRDIRRRSACDARLAPAPITTKSIASRSVISDSSRIPASLRPATRMSFGHLQRMLKSRAASARRSPPRAPAPRQSRAARRAPGATAGRVISDR